MTWYNHNILYVFADSLDDALSSLNVSSDVASHVQSIMDKKLKGQVFNYIRQNPSVTLSDVLFWQNQQIQRDEERQQIDPYTESEKSIANSFPANMQQWILTNLRKLRFGKPLTDPPNNTYMEAYNILANSTRTNEIQDFIRSTEREENEEGQARFNLSSYDIFELNKLAQDWHQRQIGKGDGKEFGPTDPNLIVHGPNNWSDPSWNGWTIQEVRSENDLNCEGSQVGHCVGGYYEEVQNGTSQIFSLRDPSNKSHVTIEVDPSDFSLKQINGNGPKTGNVDPGSEYKMMVGDWLKAGDVNPNLFFGDYIDNSDISAFEDMDSDVPPSDVSDLVDNILNWNPIAEYGFGDDSYDMGIKDIDIIDVYEVAEQKLQDNINYSFRSMHARGIGTSLADYAIRYDAQTFSNFGEQRLSSRDNINMFDHYMQRSATDIAKQMNIDKKISYESDNKITMQKLLTKSETDRELRKKIHAGALSLINKTFSKVNELQNLIDEKMQEYYNNVDIHDIEQTYDQPKPEPENYESHEKYKEDLDDYESSKEEYVNEVTIDQMDEDLGSVVAHEAAKQLEEQIRDTEFDFPDFFYEFPENANLITPIAIKNAIVGREKESSKSISDKIFKITENIKYFKVITYDGTQIVRSFRENDIYNILNNIIHIEEISRDKAKDYDRKGENIMHIYSKKNNQIKQSQRPMTQEELQQYDEFTPSFTVKIVGTGSSETVQMPDGMVITGQELLNRVIPRIQHELIKNNVHTIDTSPIYDNPDAFGLALSSEPGVIHVDISRIIQNVQGMSMPPNVQTDGTEVDEDYKNYMFNSVISEIEKQIADTAAHESKHNIDYFSAYENRQPFTTVQEGPAEQFGEEVSRRYFAQSHLNWYATMKKYALSAIDVYAPNQNRIVDMVRNLGQSHGISKEQQEQMIDKSLSLLKRGYDDSSVIEWIKKQF